MCPFATYSPITKSSITDDCVIYKNIKSPMDFEILQDDLNSLAQGETDWQMKFNVD